MPFVTVSLNDEDTVRLEGQVDTAGDNVIDLSYYEFNPTSESWNDLPFSFSQRLHFEHLILEKYFKDLNKEFSKK